MSKVDLKKYKPQIDSVLRNLNESFSRDTTSFWHFLDRFQHIEASQQNAEHASTSGRRKSEHRSDLSSKHNFELNLKDTGLSTKVQARFCSVFSHYFAFAQASKFKALQKIDDDRRTLPICTSKHQIRDALQRNDVLIVAGDTGCGKSTQVAQYLVEFGYRRIAVTQPRRIACISLANRVAFERNSPTDVGYQIRFDKQSNSHSRITFMTEGVLLRQLTADALLNQYDVLVIDEVHERHVFTDFLLGVVRCLLQARRGSVKVVLMSATINLQLFETYFRRFDAPIVTVSGRMYPIRVEYHAVSGATQPPPQGGLRAVQRTKFDPTPYVRILQLIDTRYSASDRGDVLVFLSGITEIRAVFAAVRTYADSKSDCTGANTTTGSGNAAKWIILALHSSLAAREQDRVFALAPEGYRRCILATNIAETSVTIDRVRFVVDSGRVRELCYDPHTRMERLEEFWISRASAEQRKGRAGRTGPGVCFRLYSEADYTAFQAYSPAEIHRVSLDSLVLQMVVLGLTNPLRFPFIEPVQSANLERSLRFLEEQQAVRRQPATEEKLEEDRNLAKSGVSKFEPTSIGRMLSNLPVDVPIGKMLILAAVLGERETAVTLCCAALLSAQSIFSNRLLPSSRSRDEDEPLNEASIVRLRSECGDLLTAARHLAAWLRVKSGREARNSRKWTRRHGVEEQRLYEVVKLRRQFARILADSSLGRLRSDSSSQSESDSESESDRAGKRGRDERFNDDDHSRLLAAKRQNQLGFCKHRKRRTLQMRGDEPATDSEGESGADADVNDLEMRSRRSELDALSRVADQLDDLDTLGTFSHARSRDLSVETNAMVTFVLCYGLHAQMAVGDEFNAARSAFSELVFHTSTKQFVSLHPSTCFMHDPELLKNTCANGSMAQSDATKKKKRSFSTKCEVILHGTLLETSKAYLINVLRVPALQTLLLFTRLDTNRDCSRIVCDGWLEVTFAKADEAERALRKAVSIRDKLERLLDAVLRSPAENEDDEEDSEGTFDQKERHRRQRKKPKSCKRARKRRRDEAASLRDDVAHLRSEIVSFYRLLASHTLRRVLPSELSHLYRSGKPISGTTTSTSQQPHPDLIAALGLSGELASDVNAGLTLTEERKGGQQIRSYLTLNCLVDDDEAAVWNEYTLCMQRHFQCSKCGQQFIMDVADRLRHESECTAANESLSISTTARPTDVLPDRGSVASSDRFKTEQPGTSMPCPDCRTVCSSLGDLIRHRRTCKAQP